MNAFFSAEVTFDLVADWNGVVLVSIRVASDPIVMLTLVLDDCVDLRNVEIALERSLVSQTLKFFLIFEF